MSAIGGKADIARTCCNPLMTQSGHEWLRIAAVKLSHEPHSAGRKSRHETTEHEANNDTA